MGCNVNVHYITYRINIILLKEERTINNNCGFEDDLHKNKDGGTASNDQDTILNQ